MCATITYHDEDGKLVVIQPIDTTSKDGKTSLKWNKKFSVNKTAMFKKAQKFVDSEVVRLMEDYTPMETGATYKSATISSKIGSGEIHQTTPQARFLYYGKVMVSPSTGSAWAKSGEKKVILTHSVTSATKNGMTTSTQAKELSYSQQRHPKAGKMWFEVMKSNHKQDIKRGLKTYLG